MLSRRIVGLQVRHVALKKNNNTRGGLFPSRAGNPTGL
jgi:hypothetical protein